MIGLCYDKTYDGGYEDGNEDGNGDGNVDRKNNNNAASRYDGPIFDPITTHRYCRGGSGNDVDGATSAAHYISTH